MPRKTSGAVRSAGAGFVGCMSLRAFGAPVGSRPLDRPAWLAERALGGAVTRRVGARFARRLGRAVVSCDVALYHTPAEVVRLGGPRYKA